MTDVGLHDAEARTAGEFSLFRNHESDLTGIRDHFPAENNLRHLTTRHLTTSFPRRRESRVPGIWIPDLRDASSVMTDVGIHAAEARTAGEFSLFRNHASDLTGIRDHFPAKNNLRHLTTSFPRRRESRVPGIWIPDLHDASSGMTDVGLHGAGALTAGESSPNGLGFCTGVIGDRPGFSMKHESRNALLCC